MIKKNDVLIIGGGLCGLLCAYFLDKSGCDYILIECSQIASGITKNTTAKITLLHSLIYDKAEHSWDCPCHGSRFDEKGRLLDNPSTGDAKI